MNRQGSVLVASVIVGVLAILATWSPADAKGPVDRIVISSPGAQPVEVADGAALETFTPWSRAFIAWDRGIATAPPIGLSTQITFVVDDTRPELLYEIDYVFDAKAGSGVVYVPGVGDPRAPLNSQIIMGASTSDGWDPRGKWQYATAEWDALVRESLAARGIRLAEVTVQTAPSSAAAHPAVVGAVALGVLVLGVAARRLARGR